MSTDEKPTLFEKPPETISINEVAFMYQILQACAQRGAFKPEEFKDVGVLNDKLKALVDYAKSLEEKAKEGDAASTEETTKQTDTVSTEKVDEK